MRSWFAIRDRLLARLQYEELRGVPLDSEEMTIRRRNLLQGNAAARFSFERWYRELARIVQEAPSGFRIELGSGSGFLEQFVPELVKTDVLDFPFVDKVCFAERLPFLDRSAGALMMVNVLHHVSDVDAFFSEATRVLVPGGMIAMIEPMVTPFSRLVYRYLHHEPFDPDAPEWRLPPAGRLSGGNDALPWIIFVRDRDRFERKFPGLRLERLCPHSALSHLLSGGVTTRPLAPLTVIRALARVEERLPKAMRAMGVFCTIVVRRID
jgi:SAM-dependent methyltransferase